MCDHSGLRTPGLSFSSVYSTPLSPLIHLQDRYLRISSGICIYLLALGVSSDSCGYLKMSTMIPINKIFTNQMGYAESLKIQGQFHLDRARPDSTSAYYVQVGLAACEL